MCEKQKYITFLLSKTFISFFKQKYIFLILEMYFFNIPKNSIASAFFFAKADTKKYGSASAKAFAFADCRGKFQRLAPILF